MPIVDAPNLPTPNTPAATPLMPEAKPEGSIWAAAFEQENIVVGAIDLLTRPTYEDDPSFKVGDYLAADPSRQPLLLNFKERFVGVRSQQEADDTIARINKEQANQRLLGSSGLAGIMAGGVAGMLDPIGILIPGIAYAKALKAGRSAMALTAQTGALAALSTLPSEGVLQAAQETRTIEDSFINAAGAAVVGSVLGGAAAYLTRAQMEGIAAKLGDDMAPTPGVSTIPQPTSGGAAVSVERPTGGMAGALGVEKVAKEIGPVTRGLGNTEWETARTFTRIGADAGLRMEDNAQGVPTAYGGTVENRTKVWYSGLGQTLPKLDQLYTDYFFDGQAPKLAPNMRAGFASLMGNSGKMTRKQFNDTVGAAMEYDAPSGIPQIDNAVAAFRSKVYEPLRKGAEEVELFGPDTKVLNAEQYVNYVYDTARIRSDPVGWLRNVSEAVKRNFLEDFATEFDDFRSRQARTSEAISDFELPPEARTAKLAEIEQALAKLDNSNKGYVRTTERINEIMSELRGLRKATDAGDSDLARTQARMQREARIEELSRERQDMVANEGYRAYRAERSKLRTRGRNLEYSRAGLEERAAQMMQRFDDLEQESVRSLDSLVRQGRTTLKKLDRLTDKELDKELAGLKEQFSKTAERYDRREELLTEMAAKNADVGDVMARQDAEFERLTNISERLDQMDLFDRGAARQAILDGLENLEARKLSIVQRKTLRQVRLAERMEKVSPAAIEARVAKMRERSEAGATKFQERWSEMGELDLVNGKVDIDEFVNKLVREVTERILGESPMRLPAVDILADKRGPLLSRVLNVPPEVTRPYRVTDIEQLSRIYTRTVSADIEVKRAYGDLTASEWFGVPGDPNRPGRFQEELWAKREAIENDPKLTPGQKEKKQKKLAEDYSDVMRDATATLLRLRHQYAIPDDPGSMANRLANVVSSINYLRLMGGVTLSAIPDLARPIMRYGLESTFRDGFVPFITRAREYKLGAEETRLAGTALDLVLDTRTRAIVDLMEDWQPNTKAERGLQWATNKFGLINLMAPWNAAAKQVAGTMTIANLNRAIMAVTEPGADLAKPKVARQITDLAANGIDMRTAFAIRGELTNGRGGQQIGKDWFPNTEAWGDLDVQRAYRAAIVREVDNIIVTPGVEKSLWTSSIAGSPALGRMLGQFQSFGLSATSKVMMAGLQQRDGAILSGIVASLALGALSVYIKAQLAGGRRAEEANKAGFAWWATQAVDASGLIAVLGNVNRIAERTPIGGMSNLTGEEPMRAQAGDVWQAGIGPSADLGIRLARAAFGITDPTQTTVHDLRMLAPAQNLIGIQKGFDYVEKAINQTFGIPKRRD